MEEIGAFTEGNSLVVTTEDKLIIGNSIGILKVFNLETNEEPKSIDILENLTQLTVYDNELLCTNTEGNLQLVNLDSDDTKTIYRSELPLRDCKFINEGKRIVVGGDDNKLIFINKDNFSTYTVDLADQMVSLSYNFHHELITVSLSNGNLLIYSVINEQPNLEETISKMLPIKINSSIDNIDYDQEHRSELICTKPVWNKLGDTLYVPTLEGIKILNRDWEVIDTISCEKLVDFTIEDNNLIMLTNEILIQQLGKKSDNIRRIKLDNLGINLAFNKVLFIGTNNGLVSKVPDLLPADTSMIEAEAEEANDEEDAEDEVNDTDTLVGGINRNGIDDSIIDEEDEFPYYNQPASKVLDEQGRKRQKLSPVGDQPSAVLEKIIPYSPGSTPFRKSGGVERRYLTMNSIGYVWAVNNDNVQSVTVTFFDRSVHKDYHFNDYSKFDLCSVNETGILLGLSNVDQNQKYGFMYYRSHNSDQDSWEKKIPLVKDEFITSISITNNEDDDHIVVGTNMGYLRVYNKHGLCINISKISPIVSIITNKNLSFIVSQLSINLYSFSIINLSEFKFIQQDCILPLKFTSNKPLIKGIFFNEFNDPCIVPGSDDTLIILSNWRDSSNCTWIPILNCKLQTWKCWPLGIFNDKLNCLVIKNNDEYPGFPLPLPIELELKLPINHQELEGEEEDHEELFVKAITMGKITNDSLIDSEFQQYNDEISDKLQYYTNLFDKSLLQLFVKSCQASELNKAYSISKLMKNDKVLIAATKICERFEFSNLAMKIGKLRDQLIDVDDM